MGTKKYEMSTNSPPIACTIAGTDSGGNAGLGADLATFAAHCVHGVFAVTVVTAQNTTGIAGVETLNGDFVGSQLDALAADFSIGATKTGLLFSVPAIEAVAARVATLGTTVIDPVLVTSNGVPMLADEVPQAYIDLLFPHADVITPNVAEAALLTGVDIIDETSAVEAGRRLRSMGPGVVVITGLLLGDESIDTIVDSSGDRYSRRSRVQTNNVLGTGCSLSAATTALLASGWTIDDAIDAAAGFVHAGLQSGATWKLGAGRGPIDHFVPTAPLEDRRV